MSILNVLFGNATLAIFGIVLSAYSIYVEHKTEHKDELDGEDEFKALCDIDAIGASCSAVFALPEGKMLSYFGIVPHGHALDLPNGYLGIIFYIYILVRCNFYNKASGTQQNQAPFLFQTGVNLFMASSAFASSLFLARKLYIIKEICVLCLSTHVINTTIFIRSMGEFPNNNSRDGSEKVKGQ